jgi:hypothetical protein
MVAPALESLKRRWSERELKTLEGKDGRVEGWRKN